MWKKSNIFRWIGDNIIKRMIINMTIAITDDLKNIKNALRFAGHNVVTYGQYTGAVDAVVYRGNLLSGITSISNHKDGGGILMINAENKNITEILEYLKYKTYSKLIWNCII